MDNTRYSQAGSKEYLDRRTKRVKDLRNRAVLAIPRTIFKRAADLKEAKQMERENDLMLTNLAKGK